MGGAMPRHLTAILAAVLTPVLGGCGTASNLRKDGPPYGGVREAAEAGARSVNSAGEGHCIPPLFDYAQAGYWFAVDVPLSAVADTLTLPLALPGAFRRTS